MKALLTVSAIASIMISGQALAADPLIKKANQHFAPIPLKAPALKGNPITNEKVELGKMLFFDPRLSASGLISCNTCHNLGMGGDDNLETSIGHGWQKGPRNSPTVLNSVFNVAQFWDGRAEDLKTQAKGPVQAGVEMAASGAHVETTLNSMPEYVTLFKQSFPGEKTPVSFDNMAKAIEAFEATLNTPNAPFDKFLRGNANALNAEQKKGLALFMDKGCVSCHGGMNLGGQGYFPFGVAQKPAESVLPAGDKGRYAVTKTESDKYVFRAPPLRNVALTAPYFHSGNVWSLEEAVAIMGSSQLGIKLNKDEVKAITAFLGSVTGDQPKVSYPILPPSNEKTPKPVAMIQSSGSSH